MKRGFTICNLLVTITLFSIVGFTLIAAYYDRREPSLGIATNRIPNIYHSECQYYGGDEYFAYDAMGTTTPEATAKCDAAKKAAADYKKKQAAQRKAWCATQTNMSYDDYQLCNPL